MDLTQPVVGSVGWGDSVNLNFQTLEDWVNALPQGSGVPGNLVNFDGGGNLADSGVAVGTAPNDVVQLDGSGRLPAVDGSQLTGLPVPYIGGSFANLVNLDGGGFPADSGVTFGSGPYNLVQLDGSARLPAVDGSLLSDVNASSLGGYSLGLGAWGILQLDASARLPAVDGSLLTGVGPGGLTLPSSAPSVPAQGSLYFDGAGLFLYNGSSWIQLYPT